MRMSATYQQLGNTENGLPINPHATYLDSLVKHKLFQSYCNSYYGCELCLLNNPKLEDLCGAW